MNSIKGRVNRFPYPGRLPVHERRDTGEETKIVVFARMFAGRLFLEVYSS
jgi:hypothetical protein